MNRQAAGSRMSSVAAASVGRGHGDETTDLAGAVHEILTTLTDVRRETSAAELGDRIALVKWLHVELAAVETLLTSSYGHRTGTAEVTREPDRAG